MSAFSAMNGAKTIKIISPGNLGAVQPAGTTWHGIADVTAGGREPSL